MAGGRPREIKNPKQFDRRAEGYFEECRTNGEPILLTGLIRALGLSSRSALDNYETRPEFVNSVKKAKLRVEEEYEKRLQGQSPTGAIFALKNFGWRDQQQIEHSGGLKISTQVKLAVMELENERRGDS
jgi:hypothetical protein